MMSVLFWLHCKHVSPFPDFSPMGNKWEQAETVCVTSERQKDMATVCLLIAGLGQGLSTAVRGVQLQ